jgi:hypothetical protein
MNEVFAAASSDPNTQLGLILAFLFLVFVIGKVIAKLSPDDPSDEL